MGIKDIIAIALITCGVIAGACCGIVGGAGGMAFAAEMIHLAVDNGQ